LKYWVKQGLLLLILKKFNLIASILLIIVIPVGIVYGSCGELSSGCVMGGTEKNDHLFGTSLEDLIYGLDGNDIIQADLGDDFILPGNGADEINGGDGNDVIYLQDDGEIDLIICGDGEDVILVDNIDLEIDPADILIGCERVGTLKVSYD